MVANRQLSVLVLRHGLTAWVTAVALAGAPVVSAAAPAKKAKTTKAKASAKAEDADEAALSEARDMFERGRAKYDTFDYAGAIEIWQQAYAKVPEGQSGVRNAMVYNIALAQEKAYEVDKDAAHLRQAVLLLESWVLQFKSLYARTPETEAEVNKAQARIDELNAKIHALETGQPMPEPVVDPETPEESPGDEGVKSANEIEFDSGYTPPPEVLRNREQIAAENQAEGFIAGGWTVTGIGGLFALSGAGALIGFGDRPAGFGGGIGGLSLGAAMLITGGVLLGLGYKKKKALKTGSTASVSFAPSMSPRMAGATMQLRF